MNELVSTIIVSAILGLIVLFIILRMRKNKGCHSSCSDCSKDCVPNMRQFINNYKKENNKV